LESEFEKRASRLIRSDKIGGSAGKMRMAQFETSCGLSFATSGVLFLDEVDEHFLNQVPDYVLSETLEGDLDTTVSTCALFFKRTKYLPDHTEAGSRYGALTDGAREGTFLRNWEDFSIENFEGKRLYTEDDLSTSPDLPEGRLAAALELIVKDICDDGRMLSEDWYLARILQEYFRSYPVSADSAYLIGALFKELSIKEAYEGDLAEYYKRLAASQAIREKGADATKKKAQELRDFCVQLFVSMAVEAGPRLMFAPPDVQAEELRKRALLERGEDFQRAGRAYQKEWFLQNVIEDRKLDIVDRLEAALRN
jgi:hypothetical protein